jgi:hypothetical protein
LIAGMLTGAPDTCQAVSMSPKTSRTARVLLIARERRKAWRRFDLAFMPKIHCSIDAKAKRLKLL